MSKLILPLKTEYFDAIRIAEAHNAGWLKKRDETANKKEARDYETMAIAAAHIAEALRNTRPAPAATDTGLKTIGFVPPMFVEGKGADYNDIFRSVSIAENYTAVVTRSQAVELLAAERANCRKVIEDYHTLATNASKRADALEAKLAAAEKVKDAMRKAAVDYCWQRYKSRAPMNLKDPAVFTSHEWEKIGEAMDAAIRAVLGGKPS